MIDFLVIGGGIAGLSAGARLSELGHVTVLEAEPHCGYHASGRSAALFEETYGAPSTIALNKASRDWHLFENRSIDTPRGLMLLGSATTGEAFAQDLAAMNMHRLTMAEAQAMVPLLDANHITEVAFHAEAYDVDTDAALTRFTRMITASGGKVLTKSPASAINRTGQGWQVTAGEVFEARILVNAAGAWSDQIAQMAGMPGIGLQPMRRSIARVAAPEAHDVSKWPMLFGPGETWYAKPDAGALLISPADEDPVPPQDAWADDSVLAQGIARYQPHITAEVTRMLANWAGLRSFSPDRQLVLGPAPQDAEFIWCAAQGGYGFQTAPAASQLVADLVASRPSELSPETRMQLSPARFF